MPDQDSFRNPKYQTQKRLLEDRAEYDLIADALDHTLKHYETNTYRNQADAIDQELRLRSHRDRIRKELSKKANRPKNGRPKKKPLAS